MSKKLDSGVKLYDINTDYVDDFYIGMGGESESEKSNMQILHDTVKKVGSSELATTDKTLSGAINELNGNIPSDEKISSAIGSGVQLHNSDENSHADIRIGLENVQTGTLNSIKVLQDSLNEEVTNRQTEDTKLDDKVRILSTDKADKYLKKRITQSQLDNLAQAMGINVADGMVFGCLVQEPTPPYLYNGAWYEITEYYHASLYRTQIAKGSYHSAYMKERKMVNGVWGSWTEYATTDKIDISLLNGWALVDGVRSVFKSGNIVSFNLGISTGIMADGTILFTLPTGYRPSNTISFVMTYNDASYAKKQCIISIDINGNVKLGETITSNTRIILNISYGVV